MVLIGETREMQGNATPAKAPTKKESRSDVVLLLVF
uniref:Uncharacterized protein n=1 Tax=Siphoviridae sp. ct8WU9 TaxID=2825364 RepID=A0A8S5PSW1_9CAUD|nr:MAG TPA: hypothetical protein [Siphoviridae sp. ct8WU9]DAI97653.1 MAG TPA: hypothetical protein [Caudoviricetes sp.]